MSMVVPPSLGEYVRLVKNWRNFVYVPELRDGAPVMEASMFGDADPMPRSGQFACVFFWSGPVGERLAVRCFLGPVGPQKKLHYAAVEHAVETADSPYLVKCKFYNPGIRTREGVVLPIVVMERAEGMLLDDFIDEAVRLGRRRLLLATANHWLHVLEHLRERGIAHGDLQHGNIILDEHGGIKLVDYDALYTPTVANLRPDESGHENYRHPRRTVDSHGKDVDGFSGLLVLVSLLAAAHWPEVWQRFKRDDALIFRKEDLEDPARSDVFGVLGAARGWDPLGDLVAGLTGILAKACLEADPSLPLERYALGLAARLDEVFKDLRDDFGTDVHPGAGTMATTPAAAPAPPPDLLGEAARMRWDASSPDKRRSVLWPAGFPPDAVSRYSLMRWDELPAIVRTQVTPAMRAHFEAVEGPGWLDSHRDRWSVASAMSMAGAAPSPTAPHPTVPASRPAAFSPDDDLRAAQAARDRARAQQLAERAQETDARAQALNAEAWDLDQKVAAAQKEAKKLKDHGTVIGLIVAFAALPAAFFLLLVYLMNWNSPYNAMPTGTLCGIGWLFVLGLAWTALNRRGRAKREWGKYAELQARQAEVQQELEALAQERASLGM